MMDSESDTWDAQATPICQRLVRWKHRSMLTESKQREQREHHALIKRSRKRKISEFAYTINHFVAMNFPPKTFVINHSELSSVLVNRLKN
jgi:hypothetical protein